MLKLIQSLHNSTENTNDRDSSALQELHAITAVDWLERRMQCTRKQLLLYHLHTLNRVRLWMHRRRRIYTEKAHVYIVY